MEYRRRLAEREQRLGRPIRIGLVGAGQMGRGFVAQTARIPGMEVVAVADVVLDRAERAASRSGRKALVVDDSATGAAWIDEGGSVACGDASLLATLPVDIVVEASGIPAVASKVALEAILCGRHVALLTVEADVTVGMVLSRLARQSGVTYTVCRGDEPVEALQLVDYARNLGFEVVCAGKGKNNPLRPLARPDELVDEALQKGMNPKMLCSFVDGSKTMIEMAALANAADLSIGWSGMRGAETTVEALAEVFRPRHDGGILDRPGMVDFATGPVAPGVFVVVRSDEQTVIEEMNYLKMGPGPYFALYRPYHLASIEAPLSVAAAVIDGVPDLVPVAWNAEVVATAKADLSPGSVVEGIGGSSVRGFTVSAERAAAEDLLPLGLAAGARVLRPVRVGEPLSYRDVEIDDSTTICTLRRLQDQLASLLQVQTPGLPIGAMDVSAPHVSAPDVSVAAGG